VAYRQSIEAEDFSDDGPVLERLAGPFARVTIANGLQINEHGRFDL